MTEARRRAAALRLRQLLDQGVPRKMAFYTVIEEIRKANPELPVSRSSIYAWCQKFDVSTR